MADHYLLMVGNALFASVHALLKLRWSPQQIAARLTTLHRDEAAQRVSHETIYNVIYAQPEGNCVESHRAFAPGAHQALATLTW